MIDAGVPYNEIITRLGEHGKELNEDMLSLAETLNLQPAQKTNLFSYIQKRLAQGATLTEVMRTLAQSTTTEAGDIKSMLSPGQRQLFEQITAPMVCSCSPMPKPWRWDK